MKKITFYTCKAALLLFIITGFVAGCASVSHGTKIDKDKVSQIKKGVTTKAEVELLLGHPAHTSMAGDGRRMMTYNFTEASSTQYIPVVGLFAGGSSTHTQSLQIMITKSGVVEDYEYSDNSQNTEGGILNSKTVATPKK